VLRALRHTFFLDQSKLQYNIIMKYIPFKSVLPMDEVIHWFETASGEKLFVPYHWETKISLQ